MAARYLLKFNVKDQSCKTGFFATFYEKCGKIRVFGHRSKVIVWIDYTRKLLGKS